MTAGDDLAAGLTEMFTRWTDRVVEQAASDTTLETIADAPRDTGRLRFEIHYINRSGFPVSEVEIRSDAEYSSFVDLGRGPVDVQHTITTKTGKTIPGFLHFRIGGRSVFVRHVGPAAPRDFFITKLPDRFLSNLYRAMLSEPLT